MKSEVKEEIQTYIRYINENDLRDKCEEYIQMFFFLSQMMLEESLGADERVIQSMAQKMVGLLGQDLDIDFASPNDGMYGGLGVLTFSVHEIMGRTGELKETSELLDRFLLDQACQKADLFQQRKLSFGSYDILGGIAGVVYYLLDCEEILNQPEENAGWCYGNLGIVRSLMKTAKYLRKPMEYAYYLDKLTEKQQYTI